jgi:hypothetical protein
MDVFHGSFDPWLRIVDSFGVLLPNRFSEEGANRQGREEVRMCRAGCPTYIGGRRWCVRDVPYEG